jgi:perosamine synthetase
MNMSQNKMIPLFKVFIAEEAGKPLLDVLYSGYIGEGPKVKEFEEKLSTYLNNKKLVTVNSGTSSLHMAYHLAINSENLKTHRYDENAEVITTAITCTATNTPIIASGAKLVWADVDPLTGNIDPEDIESKITKNTKAITMVHWGGNPCEIEKINNIAKKHNIKTIEDSAHAMGMKYKGQMVGNHSDYTAFSFQAIKHITSVDGGLLVVKSEQDLERAKLLRWFGIDRTIREGIDLRCELDVAEAGYKFHMNDVCAVIGLHNLAHVDKIVGKHRENALFYNKAFANSNAITISPENPDGASAYWLYTLHVNNRDELMQKLTAEGIMSSKVHARNDTHSMFKEFKAELPNAQKFNDSHICIPVGWWVTEQEREYIAEKVIKHAR